MTIIFGLTVAGAEFSVLINSFVSIVLPTLHSTHLALGRQRSRPAEPLGEFFSIARGAHLLIYDVISASCSAKLMMRLRQGRPEVASARSRNELGHSFNNGI